MVTQPSTSESFLSELAELDFKRVDSDCNSQGTYMRETEEIDVLLVVIRSAGEPRFYLEYVNDFIQITTKGTYPTNEGSIASVLNPFLYNITRLKGVEKAND